MTTGNSQSQSITNNNDNDIETLQQYIDRSKKLLNERYKSLLLSKQSTDSIGDRYELIITINELKTIYNLLFGKEN